MITYTGSNLAGLVLIQPTISRDARGFFLESYNRDPWRDAGIDCEFVQDNHSRSVRGTLRGMHFQTTPGQAKLVRVVSGKIFDVAVDIRPGSPTLGAWEGFELDADMHRQLFIPVGFAHGFCVLSDFAEVLYKVSSPYDPSTEAGFRWDDTDIGIQWPIADPLVSERDRTAPSFGSLRQQLAEYTHLAR